MLGLSKGGGGGCGLRVCFPIVENLDYTDGLPRVTKICERLEDQPERQQLGKRGKVIDGLTDRHRSKEGTLTGW